MSMEIKIFREEGMWAAHVLGEKFEAEKVYPLVSDTRSLSLLCRAIKETHPNSRVWIDSKISKNPFLQARLFTCNHYKLTPDYENVQIALNHPGTKPCGFIGCDSEAWYDVDKNMYRCARSKCNAFEYPNSNYWFRLSRNARR